ncbi:hypothetical protein X740_05580 [Mesorhizobium sp. LNHC221B00]|nr:hypothetical protein X740_05580 [Mesorhizobium sp. LNHC221B00]
MTGMDRLLNPGLVCLAKRKANYWRAGTRDWQEFMRLALKDTIMSFRDRSCFLFMAVGFRRPRLRWEEMVSQDPRALPAILP